MKVGKIPGDFVLVKSTKCDVTLADATKMGEFFFFFFYICVKLTSKRASEEEKNNENRFSIRHASYGASEIF